MIRVLFLIVSFLSITACSTPRVETGDGITVSGTMLGRKTFLRSCYYKDENNKNDLGSGNTYLALPF